MPHVVDIRVHSRGISRCKVNNENKCDPTMVEDKRQKSESQCSHMIQNRHEVIVAKKTLAFLLVIGIFLLLVCSVTSLNYT